MPDSEQEQALLWVAPEPGQEQVELELEQKQRAEVVLETAFEVESLPPIKDQWQAFPDAASLLAV